MDTNQNPAKRATKKKKDATYRIEIWNRRFCECRNTQTGDIPVVLPKLIEVKDQTLPIDDWLVKICEQRNAIVITCKSEHFDGDLICAKTVPLKSGYLYLEREFDGTASIFFREPDYEKLLRERGIFNIERRNDLGADGYSGKWHDAWITGTGESKIPDQDLFWVMSDGESAACQIASPDGSTSVLSPLDDQLRLYDGGITYHPVNASWVVTYESHRHGGSVSSGATLYIQPDRELDEAIVQ